MKTGKMKLNMAEVWRERFAEHLKESIYYGQLIASSGFLFSVLILFFLSLIYYEQLLAQIPENFPLFLCMAFFFAWWITRVKFRTLLKEADLLFFTVLEPQMDMYLRKARRYNLLMQACSVLAFLLILMPIYTHRLAGSGEQSLLVLYLVLPLLLKGWNVHSAWQAYQVQDSQLRRRHTVARFGFNFLFLALFFSIGMWNIAWIWFVLMGVCASLLILFYKVEAVWKKEQHLNWLYLLKMEKQLETRFYQFAQGFVDVPKLGVRVKERAGLAYLTNLLSFRKEQAYTYLYVKTFFRANDYFGIYVRLTLVGLVVLWYVGHPGLKGLVGCLFLWLSSTQLSSLWQHHTGQFWFSLYPLSMKEAVASFLTFAQFLLGLQALIFAAGMGWFAWQWAMGMAIVGLLFAYGYPALFWRKKFLQRG